MRVRTILAALVMGLLLSAVGCVSVSGKKTIKPAQPGTSEPRLSWDYRQKWHCFEESVPTAHVRGALQTELDAAGKAGWELVGITVARSPSGDDEEDERCFVLTYKRAKVGL